MLTLRLTAIVVNGLYPVDLGLQHVSGLALVHLTPIVHWLLKGEILPSTTQMYNFSTNWVNGSGHKKFKQN